MTREAACIFAAYALGCLNSAYYLVRFKTGLDIRDYGSGNAGASNAGRLLGYRFYWLIAALEAFKGILTVSMAGMFSGQSQLAAAAALLALVAGNIFPAQLNFRGGKGVASFVGGVLMLLPWREAAGYLAMGSLLLLFPRLKKRGGLLLLAGLPLLHVAQQWRLMTHDKSVIWGFIGASIMLVIGAHFRKDECGMVFKQADTEEEFEQIFRLNHQTFALEIPQHAVRKDGRLQDRFHAINTYFICKKGRVLVGMLAFSDTRPFSLDGKVENLDACLPEYRGKICEIRLLSIRPEYRKGKVLKKLLLLLLAYGKHLGIGFVVISATVRELKLYSHLGFVPFGKIVGAPEALYQPMYAHVRLLEEHLCVK